MRKLSPLLLLLAVGVASATTLQIMTLDDMTAQSSAVVHGRILTKHSEWLKGQGSQIVTRYTVQADQYYKGNLGKAFILTEPGGSVNNLGSITGAPEFQVGEELVLFVWTGGGMNLHQAIGFDQGAFRVIVDKTTGSRVVDHTQPMKSGGQLIEAQNLRRELTQGVGARSAQGLDQFLAQVSDSVRRMAAVKGVR